MASDGFPLLQVNVTKRGRQPVVELIGELDVASAAQARSTLEPLVSQAQTLTIDATQLTFADVSGLDVLLAAAEDLQSRGGRVVVRHPTRIVRRVIDLLRLDEVFELE